MSSPYKLHIHKWADNKSISMAGASMCQYAAALTPAAIEMVKAFRQGELEKRLPARPPLDVWQNFYRSPGLLTHDLGDAMPEVSGSGSYVTRKLRNVHRFAVTVEKDPEQFKSEIASMSRKEVHRLVNVSYRLARRHYNRNLRDMQGMLHNYNDWADASVFERELHEAPAVYFFIRITLPCFILCEDTPANLLQRASNGEADAIEKLLRLDDRAGLFPEVDRWINEEQALTRIERRAQATQWMHQGFDYGREITTLRVKQIMGGLAWAMCKLFKVYLDLSDGQCKPCKVTASDIRELMNASAKDRTKPSQRRGFCDAELYDLTLPSWRQSIRKPRDIWFKMFGQWGARKSARV